MRDIIGQPALAGLISREHFPGKYLLQSDKDCADYGCKHGRAACRSVGTCKMGTDPMAAVDPQLRVHGIKDLRVSDSSTKPDLIRENLQAVKQKGAAA